jgi:hypothetical protein
MCFNLRKEINNYNGKKKFLKSYANPLFSEIALHSQGKLKRVQEIVEKAYHDKALTRMQILAISKRQRRRNRQRQWQIREISMQRLPSPIWPLK